MKTTIQFAILSCFFCGNVAFGGDAEIVYIDSGLISYCQSSNVNNAVVALCVREIAFTETRKHYLLGSTYPSYTKGSPAISRFPSAWMMKGKTLKIVFPDVIHDAMNSITFGTLTVDDITLPGNDSDNSVDQAETYGEVKIYRHRPRQLFGCRAGAFTVDLLRDSRNEILWYGFSDTNFIARLPLTKELVDNLGDIWMPCASPDMFRWMEFRYTGWDSYKDDLEILHSEDFRPDGGFAPIGSVRIAGKRVLSDDPKATFPKDADWLIWEKDGDAYRLCQMREGRWSVCKDASRMDAPKVIVINNDSNTVFLLYSLSMNAEDVDGSLQKIISFLKNRGALQHVRNEKE